MPVIVAKRRTMSKIGLDKPNKVDAGFSFRPISPSAFTRKPMEVTNNPGFQLTADKPPVFQFGNPQSDAEKKVEKKFTFVLNVGKSDESGSGADKSITNVKEMESKSNAETRLETSEETITEDTNRKYTIQIRDRESNEQKQKSEEGKEKTDEEISIKILFKEFKEIIIEFSKERAEYEKRITALETRIETVESATKLGIDNINSTIEFSKERAEYEKRIADLEKKIEALESSRKLGIENISSTGKGDEGHDAVHTNCAKDMSFAIQPLPVAIPSFISPHANIVGSTPLYSSATAQTPNFMFGATAFPSKSAPTTELSIPCRQLNNSPFSLCAPMLQTNLLSNTENTILKEINNTGKENSNLLFFNKQINTDNSFANKGSGVINTSLKANEGLEKKNQRTSEAPNHLEHQTDQNIELASSLDYLRKSIEESFQKAIRDIFAERKVKDTLASAFDKKD